MRLILIGVVRVVLIFCSHYFWEGSLSWCTIYLLGRNLTFFHEYTAAYIPKLKKRMLD
jgi:hypothetical protein